MANVNDLKRLADAASVQTLKYFRSNLNVDNKYEDGFDPVTAGDREAEAAIRHILDADFPDHGILGEEYGAKNLEARHVWVIDPIDGTRAFISGLPVWGTLVGLMEDGVAKKGFMHQPYTDELYIADGEQSWLIEKGGEPQKLATRQSATLQDATVFTTSPALYSGAEAEGFKRLEDRTKLARYGTDCYGAVMVASGYADIFIEPGLQPYDIVALIPIIEQAGGVVTTVDGARAEQGGTIIAAGSKALHEEALQAFWGRA
ncbi:histidinol-phosphatase [Ahrensia marina]|uniref:Histidinol-phosphatase n=1 Tax=Ahrensia marina TaxID=1514904 RepID=A0A0M9GLU3_9HYPH|nr:histidinol-phosphatase [Ahrensia marina]KPB00446.1 inositol monophosphatase [Ahrensia marina]